MPFHVENLLPTTNAAGGVALGLLRAEGVRTGAYPPGLADALAEVGGNLDPAREARRSAARDMLRNGRYRPTGRGKPASEYLLRAAAEGAFPRINAVVDVNNLVSARAALPISLWDLDRAGSDAYAFRLGREGEAFVFNAAGQVLDLHDLVVGCRVTNGNEEPIVTPIKDAHGTKTTPETTRVGGCIYAPVAAVTGRELLDLCAAFAGWLARCGDGVETAVAVAAPGAAVEV